MRVNFVLAASTSLSHKLVVRNIGCRFEILPQFEASGQANGKKVTQRWQLAESHTTPFGNSRPSHEGKPSCVGDWAAGLAARFHGRNATFRSRDALRLVYRHRPRAVKSHPNSNLFLFSLLTISAGGIGTHVRGKPGNKGGPV